MHVHELNEHVPSNETRLGRCWPDVDVAQVANGSWLHAADDVAQDERQDGNKSCDQGVLDQVLTPVVMNEKTRSRPHHVLLAAEFSMVCQHILQSVCHRLGAGRWPQNVRDYQICGTIVRGLFGKIAALLSDPSQTFFPGRGGFSLWDGRLLSWLVPARPKTRCGRRLRAVACATFKDVCWDAAELSHQDRATLAGLLTESLKGEEVRTPQSSSVEGPESLGSTRRKRSPMAAEMECCIPDEWDAGRIPVITAASSTSRQEYEGFAEGSVPHLYGIERTEPMRGCCEE